MTEIYPSNVWCKWTKTHIISMKQLDIPALHTKFQSNVSKFRIFLVAILNKRTPATTEEKSTLILYCPCDHGWRNRDRFLALIHMNCVLHWPWCIWSFIRSGDWNGLCYLNNSAFWLFKVGNIYQTNQPTHIFSRCIDFGLLHETTCLILFMCIIPLLTWILKMDK